MTKCRECGGTGRVGQYVCTKCGGDGEERSSAAQCSVPHRQNGVSARYTFNTVLPTPYPLLILISGSNKLQGSVFGDTSNI